MKILQVHNRYKFNCGEDRVFEAITDLLKQRGARVIQFTRNSRNLRLSVVDRFRAFVNGIYSLSSAQNVAKLIEQEHPDVVHVHNLYPLISPSVLVSITG